MRLFAVLVAVIVTLVPAEVSAQVSPNELILAEWSEFKLTHGKVYKNSRHEDRSFQIYLETRESVAKHNLEFALGRQSYRQKINKFADVLTDELVGADNELNGIKFEESPNKRKLVANGNESDILPESVDWRLQGVVTPVETQGDCDSSWAFATAGAVEAFHASKRNDLVSLSAQQLVDCSTENEGCSGGDIYNGMHYITYNDGIQDAYSYPYTGKKGSNCAHNSSKIVEEVGCFSYGGGSEETLKKVVRDGPASANIIVTDSFKQYEYGVYTDPNCTRGNRQSVLIVGYGTNYEEGDYWIVKNSWGRDWGEFGYIRVARNAGNMCGIADLSVQPCY